jgi:hypothetical protein
MSYARVTIPAFGGDGPYGPAVIALGATYQYLEEYPRTARVC